MSAVVNFSQGNSEEPASLRHRVQKAMELVMGQLPGSERRVALQPEVLAEESLRHCTRRQLTFAVEPGDRLPAYLLIPHQPLPGSPAILCLHQTTPLGKSEPAGVGGNPNYQYALHLAERGYITLAPDYSLVPAFEEHGEYQTNAYLMGYASTTMKGIWNHMRAVDLLVDMPQVDPSRIGCIGHSLGGHNALFLAAFDERVRVIVSSCGFTSFARYNGGDLAGFSHQGYMPRIADLYGNDPAKMPFDFPDIISSLAPRPFFASAPSGDFFDVGGVIECMEAAAVTYELSRAEEKLQVIHPDCGHDFPLSAREAAYAWFDHWL